MSVIAGEVVHIIKYIPVEVKYRKTEKCYLQLPVHQCTFWRNPLQVTSKSCRIQNTNYSKRLTKAILKYTNPSSSGTSGIYSQSDLDKLRDHIMFPAGKPMILNSLAREITGHPTINQGILLTYLFNQEVIDNIAESDWGRFWSVCTNFAITSACIIGLIIIIRGIKLIADTIIHGYALHRLFGWSLHLLGAFWDAVTNLLLHSGTNRPAGPPAESHQPLITALVPQNSIEEPKSSTYNKNTNSVKDHNSTKTTPYPHSELKKELSRSHHSIQI